MGSIWTHIKAGKVDLQATPLNFIKGFIERFMEGLIEGGVEGFVEGFIKGFIKGLIIVFTRRIIRDLFNKVS